MIILEGIDCVGKTTAGLMLRDGLGCWSMRQFTNPVNLGGCYRNRMGFLADAHPQVICDRFHLGDYAYEVAIRGQPGMTPHQWRLMELALMAQGALVVWMTDALENVEQRWVDDEQMYAFEQIREVQGYFHKLFMELALPWRTVLPWVELDLPAFQRGAAVGQIARRAQAMASAVRRLPPPSVGIGSVAADFLVVDEGIAPGLPTKDLAGSDPDLPLDRSPVARWFWKALDDMGCEWWKGYYTHAQAFSPEEFGWLASRTIKPRLIVCLGPKGLRVAESAQTRGLIPRQVTAVPVFHPSYSSQFNNRRFCAFRARLARSLAPWCDPELTSWRVAHEHDQHTWDYQCSEGPGGAPSGAILSPKGQEEMEKILKGERVVERSIERVDGEFG